MTYEDVLFAAMEHFSRDKPEGIAAQRKSEKKKEEQAKTEREDSPSPDHESSHEGSRNRAYSPEEGYDSRGRSRDRSYSPDDHDFRERSSDRHHGARDELEEYYEEDAERYEASPERHVQPEQEQYKKLYQDDRDAADLWGSSENYGGGGRYAEEPGMDYEPRIRTWYRNPPPRDDK